MSVRFYNSLTRKVEDFSSREPGRVNMFVCGPTVYDRVHLGNARTFTVFDVVAKWLRYRSYDVTYIQNITDIDDRIIARAAEKKQDPLEYAHAFDELFRADMRALGNDAVSRFARATDHINDVLLQVKKLRETGHAYLIEGDGWYFDLSTFPDYGKLSGRTGLQAGDAVSRIDDSEKKRTSGDFALWKLSKTGEPVWKDSDLGDGRPGWHIEDTAITEHFFGPQYDVHGGGMDLKFPHHEAEIAQQEAASGKVPFVKYWMHAGFLESHGAKMSKSTGDLTTLHDALTTVDPAVLRFYFLSNQYRSPLEFSETALDAAQAAVNRIGELARKHSDVTLSVDAAMQGIEKAMDDDFNTAAAFASVFELVREANKQQAVPPKVFFDFLSEQFGIVPKLTLAIPDAVQALVDDRENAREKKDFTTSDQLRDRLAKLGYSVDDTPYGPLVKKK